MVGLVVILAVGVAAFFGFSPKGEQAASGNGPEHVRPPGPSRGPGPDGRGPEGRGPEGRGPAGHGPRSGANTTADTADREDRARRRLEEVQWLIDDRLSRYKMARNRFLMLLDQYPDTATAGRIREVLEKIDANFARQSHERAGRLQERIEEVAKEPTSADLMGLMRERTALEKRVQDTPWGKGEGQGVIEALATRMRQVRGEYERACSAAAEAALAEGRYAEATDRAREALASADDESRPAREADFAQACAARAEAARRMLVPVARRALRLMFLERVVADGLPAALAWSQAAVREPVLRPAAEAIEADFAAFRRLQLVGDLAAQALVESREPARLNWQGREVRGRVLALTKGLLTLETLFGQTHKIPIKEISAGSLLAAARLDPQRCPPEDQIRYLILRGEAFLARKRIAKIPAPRRQALKNLLREVDDLRVRVRLTGPDPLTWSERMGLRQGLSAEVYGGDRLTGEPLWRGLAPRGVDYAWVGEPVAGQVPADGFSVCWRGFLYVPRAGTHYFQLHHDDGARLYLDGAEAYARWNAIGHGRFHAKLEAGLIPLTVELSEKTGLARCSLWWCPPGERFYRPVPARHYRVPHALARPDAPRFRLPQPPIRPLPTNDERAFAPGLRLRVYEGANDLGPAIGTTVTPRIDHIWGQGGPGPDLPADNFFAVFEGYLRVPESGQYTFNCFHDDAVVVSLDGQIVLKKPRNAHHEFTANLAAPLVSLRITVTEGGGDAGIRLQWKGPGIGQLRVVDDRYFVHRPASGRER